MSFWLRESKIMFVLCTIPKWLQWGSSVCLVTVTGAVWYVWWYQPLQMACEQATESIQKLSQKNITLYKTIALKPALELEKSALEKTLQQLVRTSKFDDCAMVDVLLESFKQHDISCKELKPLAVKRGVFWQNHSFELVFKGTFKNIKIFMHDFFAQHKFVSCNKLLLARWKENKVRGELNVSFITFGDYEKKL
jgi:hypothetical protein